MSRLIITAGFAMFSMFFGSGNLIFPILTGLATGESFLYASLGLCLTGVVVPFLGLLAIIYYQGNHTIFFRPLGKYSSFLLILAMLSLMGPVGVIPRCIIVAYGGLHLLFSHLHFWQFGIIFCTVLTISVWRQSRIITIIGNYLTPLFICAVVLLIGAGFYYAHDIPVQSISARQGFFEGIHQGYQTMDLLAAFFFSSAIMNFIKSQLSEQKDYKIEQLSLKSTYLGAALLGSIYIGLIYLGAKFSNELRHINPESLIVEIGRLTLGTYAYPVVAAIILLACLTTASILVELFAEFFAKECCHYKISRSFAILITVGTSFLISLAGFKELAHWINMCLTIVYPALLVYVMTTLINYKYQNYLKHPHWYFWVSLIVCIIFNTVS